jgi:glucose/arabinose dehydrogenase
MRTLGRSSLFLIVLVASCTLSPSPLTTTAPVPEQTQVPTTPALTTSSLPPTTLAPTTTLAPATTLAPLQGLLLETVVENLVQPLLLLSPPGDPRRFILERTGVISIIDEAGALSTEPFLDLSDRVNSGGIEQGLLGMAFHPEFAVNGRFFVYYYRLGSEQTQLSEFGLTADPGRADPASERPLLTLDKPTTRHNGGMLLFGPDGYLWMSLGEGGAASVNSQDPNRLLSAILRLDVDNGDPYGIPPDNPYRDGAGAPEVWAKGLRNPWRFTIDDGLLYIADVGHSDYEEVDVVPISGAPYNFGWLRMEGSHCFQRGCDPIAENLTLPVLEYTHSDGCSITGGFVYRGAAIPELAGHYFYADWCGEWVKSFRYSDGEVLDHQTHFEEAGQINSFGVDSAGELYVMTYEGAVEKIVPIR